MRRIQSIPEKNELMFQLILDEGTSAVREKYSKTRGKGEGGSVKTSRT